LPELYDLSDSEPDDENLAEAHPKAALEMLRGLSRSPVFPRNADDFDLRDTKEQRAEWAKEAAAAVKN
jgi:hypothetical protein